MKAVGYSKRYQGKSRKQPYRGSRAFDPSCRNNKSCPWCRENRLIQYLKIKESMKERLYEYYTDYT